MKKILFAIISIILTGFLVVLGFWTISNIISTVVDAPSEIVRMKKIVEENNKELIDKANEMLTEEEFNKQEIVLEVNKCSLHLKKEEKTVLLTIYNTIGYTPSLSITYGLNDNKLVLKDIDNNVAINLILQIVACCELLLLYILVIKLLYKLLIKKEKLS